MFNSKRNSLSLEGSTGNSLKSLKLISLIIIILLLTLITLPPDIGKAFNIKPRRKIPLSPPPISIDTEKQTKPVEAKEKRTEHSKTFKNPDGTFSLFYYPRKIHKRDGKGGWVEIDSVDEGGREKEIKTLSGGNPTSLSLCLYANGSSFTNGQTEHENEMWLENYNGVSSQTYILYPDLKDLIPKTGALTEVKIVTEFIDTNPDTFTVSAYAIIQPWNPHTLNQTNIPPTDPNPTSTAIWNLAEGSGRNLRSIDITNLANSWFSGIKGSYGVKLKIQDPPSQNPNGIQGAPLPVLLVKYQVQGAPSDPSFGGSYYSDSLTPPQLIPGRALFVHRVGDIGNIVKSWTVADLNITEGLPFGVDILSVNLKTDDTYISSQFIPTETLPCSNSYFLTYSFPALNDDIYPNNALDIIPPSQDPNPPSLNPTPPGPKSYQFLNLTENPSINHNFIDITSLIATPVSIEKYPNYPLLNNFTLVMQDDNNRFSNNIIQPLSSLPYIQLDYALDIGSDGETENTIAKGVSSFNAETFSGSINPTNLNVMLTTEALSFSTHGGLSASLTLTYNSEYGGANGSRWLTNLDQYISYDDQTNALTYHTSSGSTIRFNPIYDSNGIFNGQFYPPGSTNTKAFIRNDLPSNKRYELRSKTEDLSVFFSESNGKITFAQTKQGGNLIFNYSQSNPDLITSIEDGYTGRRLNFTYDSYNRLVAAEDPIGRMATFQYNVNNNMVSFTSYNGITVNLHYKIDTMKVDNLEKYTYIPVRITELPPPEHGTEIQNGEGNSSTVEVSPETQTATVTDPKGATTEFKFYPQGQLKELTNALGEEQTNYYDSEHASYAVKEIKDCNGEISKFNYDEDRNIEGIIDKAGNSTHTEYNEKGKPTVVTDREGNSLTCTYNQDGSLPIKYTDALGNEVSLNYDENKFLVSTTYPYKEGENVAVQYTYDANGYLDTVTDPLQNVTNYDYDNTGRLLKVTFPNGAKEELIYDENERLHQVKGTDSEGNSKISTINFNPNTGNPVSVTDPAGNTTTFNYDNYDKLTSITDPLGNSTSYEYDQAGYVTKITDARNNSVSFGYDALGRTTSVTDPLGNTYTYNYDSCGELSSVVDPLGNAVHLYYDDVGHPVQIKDPQNNIFSFTYNKEGYLKSLTDPKGANYYLNYNSIYQVTNLRNPKGTETNYEYYPFGGIKKATNALNQYVTYDYDRDFRPIKVTDHQNRFTEYTYDNAGRVTQIKDHTNRITKFKYDGFGNLTETEDPLGNKTKFEYDISNNLTATITPMNERYEYFYDALDRVIKTVDPLGHERNYSYDEVSNFIQFENPLQNITKWAYDKRDQVEKATDPLNNDFYYTYDELGRLTKEKDPLNREFNYNYNSLSQLIGVTDPNNNTTSYNYDNNYNLTKRIRPATSTTPIQEINYTFDNLDRLTKVTSPLGFETHFNYNILSMLTSITYPDSSSSSFSYDNLNRLTQINSSDNFSVSLSYDNLDRLTTLTDSINGSSTFNYDALSRITDETDPSNYSTSYSYDADSRLTEKEDDSGITSFIYDAASRLTQITAPGNLNYSISWDAGDRVNSESLPNNVTINSLYDANDRPIDIIYTLIQPETFPLYFEDPESKESSSSKSSSYPKTLPSLTILSTLTLFYYLENGRLKNQIEKDGGFTEESYDYYVKINNDFKRNLLSSQQIVSFSYTYNTVSQVTAEAINIGGNIKDYIYAYDPYDQLTTAQTPDGNYSYTFDERNNRLTQRIIKDDSDITEYYTYDTEDRLTNLKVRDTQNHELIKEINYLYDNNGNLINKTIFTGGGAQTYNYSYYVGGNLKSVILPDESQIQFTYYAGGLRANKTTDTEIISYHYQGGTLSKEVHKDKVTGEVIKTIRYIPYGIKIEEGGNGQTYFYVTDMRGTIIALTDEDGNIAETYSYDPFGNILSNPTIYNPKLFIGRDDVLYDSETELYYMHARYYDPEAGRFIMKDPIEGSLSNPITQNPYIYCANDPINKIDPAGTVTLGALDNSFKPHPPTKHGPPDVPPPPTKPPECFSSCVIPITPNGLPGSRCRDCSHEGASLEISGGYEECMSTYCKLEGEDLSKYFYDPNVSSDITDNPAVASTVLSGGLGSLAATCSIPADGGGSPSETVELPDEDFNIKIVVNDDGSYEVYAVDKKTGEKVENKKTEDLIGRIKDGINKAINELKSQNVQFDLVKALKDMAKFAATYYNGFDIRMTGGKNTWTGHFFYHAMRGAVIAQYLADEPLSEEKDPGGRYPKNPAGGKDEKAFNDYNVEIGFWCSFYDQAMGFNMKFFGINDQYIGLVEFGNLIKSMIMQESNFQQFVGNGPKEHDNGTKFGLMAVGVIETQGVNSNILRRIFGPNAIGIQEADIKESGFYNIGAGIGHLMGKLGISGRNPTKEEWKNAVKTYNGTGEKADRYLDQVWKRLNLYNKRSYEKKKPEGAE